MAPFVMQLLMKNVVAVVMDYLKARGSITFSQASKIAQCTGESIVTAVFFTMATPRLRFNTFAVLCGARQ